METTGSGPIRKKKTSLPTSIKVEKCVYKREQTAWIERRVVVDGVLGATLYSSVASLARECQGLGWLILPQLFLLKVISISNRIGVDATYSLCLLNSSLSEQSNCLGSFCFGPFSS